MFLVKKKVARIVPRKTCVKRRSSIKLKSLYANVITIRLTRELIRSRPAKLFILIFSPSEFMPNC